MRVTIALAIGLIVAVSFSADRAAAETRLALIIANQSYSADVGPLANPHNDARLIAAALERHDFDVVVHLDLSEDDMEVEVESFAERVAAAGPDAVSLFYYAGHGASRPRDGVNFLIPVSVETLDDRRLWARSVRLDTIRQTLLDIAPDAQHIVVFDACRNELALPPEVRGRRGFQAPQALGGMLTAFAASPGQFASDGAGRANGPYAEALAGALDRARGVLAEEVFARARFAVRRISPHQTPLISGGLDREVLFHVAPSAQQLVGADVETTTSPLDGAAVFLTGEAEQLALLSVFRECDVCPEMVVLPGGTYTMGSPESEPGRGDDEGPRQQVSVRSFAIGRTEVTFAQWDACVADGFCRRPSDEGWGRDQRPVINVSWNDITGEGVPGRGFLAWLNSRAGVTGALYRLPTEAEWEYAARGRRDTPYFFGRNPDRGCGHMNAADATALRSNPGWTVVACDDGFLNTAPVGSFRPNPFGLFDVHGNVWEWAQDCWIEELDASLSGGEARMVGDCSAAVIRSGSWFQPARALRSANRGAANRIRRAHHVGFRVVRTL